MVVNQALQDSIYEEAEHVSQVRVVRDGMTERAQTTEGALRGQIEGMEEVYEKGRRLYEDSKKAVGQLLPEVEVTRRQVIDLAEQLATLKERANSALRSFNELSTQRQRLARQEATAAETFHKFAKLSEEARALRDGGDRGGGASA